MATVHMKLCLARDCDKQALRTGWVAKAHQGVERRAEAAAEAAAAPQGQSTE